MWGTWWVWDACSLELILLFLYLGVIALYNAFSDKVVAGRAAGILALVGVINAHHPLLGGVVEHPAPGATILV